MRKLVLCIVCLAAMMAGTGLKAQEVTIVLMPGYTWISIPTTDTLDFETALGSFTPAVGDMIKSRWGAATFRSDGQWRGSISEFYPGYGYHYYSNRNVPVLLTFNAQQPTSQVQVTTSEPMLITAISAMGGGEVTTNDGTYILVKGLCWAAHENPTTNEDFYQEAESGVGTFSISMTGLNISTTYYVRAYAVTPNGTVYGDQKAFTTRDGIPTVTTAEITSITGATASCGGTVTDNGGLNVTARGVCWSIAHNPTINDSHTIDSLGLGSFYSSIADLNVNTTYYLRAYASTSFGTGYGEEMSFTTLTGIPEVSTTAVTNILLHSATCGGTMTDDGGLTTVRGVCWSTSPSPTVADSHTTNGSGIGSFSSNLSGLTFNTTYYVRAYATNSHITVYGNEVSFTTLEGGSANAPIGAINGLFSVSNSKQVFFSQGNLQYQATTNSWKFAEQQYDFIGNANSNISQTYNGWIDLFGWGTSGWDNGNTYYHPWDSQYNSNSLQGNGYGPNTHIGGLDPFGTTSYDLTGSYANADWGVYNPIDNGGNQSNQWRTLTMEEWNYIFNTRSTASNIRYARAQVNNVKGVILLPDDWNTSTYSLNNTNISGASFSNNILTISQWNILEQAGAVFLPAAGYRNGTAINNVGSYGCYWSTSSYYSYNADYEYGVYYSLYVGAYDVSFSSSGLAPQSNSDCNYGYSVRLVQVPTFSINVSANPTDGGIVMGDGIYQQSQNCTVLAIANAGYTFTNWTENGNVVSTDAYYTFIVAEERSLVANFIYNGGSITHEYVDLGLPSGLLWATCNVGADSPEEYGDYFAWGETQPKNYYFWSTYQYCNGTENTLTKYCNNSSYGFNGFNDNLTTLLPEDDAATANWGSNWRMPTKEEWQELLDNTTITWTTQNGVNGRLFTAANGNSLFLPAAGYLYDSSLHLSGDGGYYWSSSLDTGYPDDAWRLGFLSSHYGMGDGSRLHGFTVRPVCSSRQN